jgi:hypothetical protein
MAAVTLGVATSSTDNVTSYASDAFTPAADDLLAVCVSADNAGSVVGTLASSVAGKTFSLVTSAGANTDLDRLHWFVSDQLASNESQTVTFDCTGDAATGCLIIVLRISGITKTGTTAIKQSKVAANQSAATTPAVTFDASAQTGNPTLGSVGSRATVDLVEPTGWTELGQQQHGTPNAELETVARDSGFTGTTITWGSACDTTYAAIIVEIDASSDGGAIEGTASITEAADTLSAAGTLAIVGTASVTEAADTVSATGTLAIVGTASITEADDTLVATGEAPAASASEGEATITEQGDALAATGTLAISGALSVTEADDTLAATDATETPEEDPAPQPAPAFTGGVGGRRGLSDEDREKLLKRIRKSLGLDKEEPAPSEVAAEPVSEVVLAGLGADLFADLVVLPDEEDDEIVLLLAAA